MNPILISLMLSLSLATFAYFIYVKVHILLLVAPENRFNRIPERIKQLFDLGIKQRRLIGRKHERASGAMHSFIFWGFLVLGLRSLILLGEGFTPGFQDLLPFLHSDSVLGYLYTLLKDIFEGIVLCMVLFALYRRIILRPSRLSNSFAAFLILGLIGTLMVTDLIYDAAKFNLITLHQIELEYLRSPIYGSEMVWAPLAFLVSKILAGLGETATWGFYYFAYWIHVSVLLTFLPILPGSKHMHVITALPNVFFGSLDYPHAPAPLLDCENEEAWENENLGMSRIEHLSWKQVLDLYTCTECGRCKAVCPTYVTFKPLTLMDMNDSLKQHLEEEIPSLKKAAEKQWQETIGGRRHPSGHFVGLYDMQGL